MDSRVCRISKRRIYSTITLLLVTYSNGAFNVRAYSSTVSSSGLAEEDSGAITSRGCRLAGSEVLGKLLYKHLKKSWQSLRGRAGMQP